MNVFLLISFVNVLAIQALAGYCVKTESYTTLILAKKTGETLSKIATLVKRNAIERRDEDRIKDVAYFTQLCTGIGGLGDQVYKHAQETLNDRKRNKVDLQSLSADVNRHVLLRSHGVILQKLYWFTS